ncbi:MAG: hypothetical protein ACK5X0_07660 [Rhodospirillales bacterium]|jgi:hypothetical protein
MKVGTLEIEMLANMARLQKDMNDAKRIVGDAAQSIERYAALAKAALAGISVAGLVSLAKSAIDAMDAIRDLSLATNISVEDLAGLGVAAKQSGGDLNSIAAAMNKLSVNIGKDGERFKALGITAKEPIEAFKQLSDVFVNLKDPQQRAAVMAEALGKSWMGAAPLLAEGGAKIGELVEVGTRLSGVTKQMTDEADAFNDKLVLLGGTGGFATRMIGPLLPLLNALADEMLKAQDKSTSLGQSFSPLLEIGKALTVLFGNVAFVFRGVGTEIGGMAAQIAAFASGDIKGGLAIGRAMKEDAEKARAEFDAWEKSIMSIGTASTAAIAPVKGLSQEQQRASQAAAAAAATFLGAQKAGTDEITKLLAKINGKESGLDPSFYDDLQKLFGAYKGGKLTLEQYRDVVEKLTNQQPFVKAGLEAEAKALEHLNKLRAEAQQQEVDAIDARNSMIDGMTDGNAMLQAEIAEMLGAKNAQRELTLAREEALAIRLALTDEDEASVIALYAQKRALLEQKDAIQQSRSAFSSWYDIIDGGFKAALQGAKSFGDYLKNGLKNALYQLVARPFVIQLAATLTGSSASSVAGALGGNGGGIGSLLGGLGSLSGIGGSLAGGLTSIGLGGAGQFVGGLTGAISGPGLTGAAGAGSSAAGMLSAAGPYIAAAMAAYALYQRFARSGGGAKEGGSFLGDFSSTGTLLREDPRRFYDSSVNQMDPQMRGLAQGTATSYAAYVRAFGGTARDFTFGFGADTDPRGTAQDRVSATAWDRTAGRGVYMNQDRNVGRNGQIPAELQLESQRALIAALQATEMPAAIKKLFEGVDAMGLTADAANKLLSTATEYAAAIDALKASIKGLTIDGLLAMQVQGETLTQTFQRVASAFSNYENLFVPETERNQKLFDALTDKLKEQNALLPATREGYRALVDSLDLSDASQRALWQTLIDAAGVADLYYNSLTTVADVMTDTADVMTDTADTIARITSVAGEASDTFDAFGNAMESANTVVANIAQALDNLKNIAGFQGQNNATIAGIMQGRAGYNYGAYLQGNVNTARTGYVNSLSGSVSDRIAGASGLRDSLSAQYQYQMQQLQQQQQTQIAAQQTQIAAQRTLISQAQQLGETFKSLGQYGRSLLVGSFSTLSPEAQLAAAGGEYQSLLMRARGGDRNAASGLQSASQTYLQQAQGFYGSAGQYAAIFSQVQGDLAAFSGLGDQQLELAQSMSDSLETLTNTLTPEMIDLQDRFIAELELLNSDAEAWAAEQRTIASENATIYRYLADNSAEVARNTAGLRSDIQQLVAVLRPAPTPAGGNPVPMPAVAIRDLNGVIIGFTKAAGAMTDSVALGEARQKVVASNA